MKTKVFIKVTILCFVLQLSCQVSAQGKIVQAERTTIVFIDKTLSVEQDSLIQEKNHLWLKRIIKDNMSKSGDRMILSFIFENTSSSANKFEFIYHPPKPQTGRMSSSEARIREVKYKKRLRSYKKCFTTRIINTAFSKTPTRSGTDVVGTIKLLSDFSRETMFEIKAFYLSDMQECSPFRRLACTSSKPTVRNVNEASNS